jgi:hypothetical protein
MVKCKRGFTIVEFAFGMALFALAIGMLVPNTGCVGYISAREKSKEAEVKSNIHRIQIALERFAIDTGGEYPFILYGGDGSDTFATSKSPPPPENPDYEFWPGDFDALLEGAYLSSYPENPFQEKRRVDMYGKILTNPGENGFESLETKPGRVNIWVLPHDRATEYMRRGVGGEKGKLMWDISEGQRHAPWPIVVVPDPSPSPTGFVNPAYAESDAGAKRYSTSHQFWLTPGNFYYYAIFDGVGGYSGFVDADGDGFGDPDLPVGGVVIGFVLAGYGAQGNPGMDVYNLYGDYPERSLFTINNLGDPDAPNLYVGPDGRPDGVIITVESGIEWEKPPGG